MVYLLGVMPAGQLLADLPELQRRDVEALSLDTADDLAYQLSLDAVRLDQYQGPFSHGAQRTEPPQSGGESLFRTSARR
jgi:hypothetical protein